MPFACLASVTYLFGDMYIVDICDSHQVVAASLEVFKQSPFPAHSQVFFLSPPSPPTAEEEESGKGEKRKRETDDEGEDD